MSTGRTIKIFLADGSASGLRTAELGLSTIKAVVIPRASLSAVSKRSEPTKTGVYVLIGKDETNPGQKMIYIGEGDTIINRLNSHNKDESKEFWEEAVIFVSKDENLTKAHVRYLEARLIALANEAKRASVSNGTAPTEQGKLPEPDQSEMEEFIVQARLLLGTLGYDLFEPASFTPAITSTSSSVSNTSETAPLPVFQYIGEGFDAKCAINLEAGQFVVKAGSIARKDEASALAPTYINLRASLFKNGVLILNEDKKAYVFSQDFSFKSITAAAQVVSATTVRGRLAWKLGAEKNSKTFDEWENALIKDID